MRLLRKKRAKRQVRQLHNQEYINMYARKKINRTTTQRKKRIRARIKGDNMRPRLSVFRSNRFISAQVIDNSAQKTLCAISSKDIKEKASKSILAEKVGILLAEKMHKLHIEKVVFDRGAYRYHGIIKIFAEAVRKAGILF